jgi:excisionase family DNA binding protein
MMSVLGGKSKRRNEVDEEPRILDVNASMQGSLIFQEPVVLRISGRFDGTLQTRGELVIGDEATVSADITGEMITIAGQVTGKVVAKQSLKVVPPARLQGEIWTPVFEVEAGANIDGVIHMSEQGVWMTPGEVAEYLEVEARLIEQWAQEGKLGGLQKAGQWHFEKAKIDEWVASQKSS